MEEAHLQHLEAYLDCFYEDNIDLKTNSARKILLLTIDMQNTESLLQHG